MAGPGREQWLEKESNRSLSSPAPTELARPPSQSFLPTEAGFTAFLNADVIARGISPFNPDSAALAAGRIMLEQLREHVARRESFALETTLAARNYIRHIPEWRKLGYQVMLVFLSLPSPELAVARVAARVAQGGHNIPEEVIRRRFNAGLQNFRDIYRTIVDAWILYDSSTEPPTVIDEGINALKKATRRKPDLNGVKRAMTQASVAARKLAESTHTPFLVWKDGKVTNLNPTRRRSRKSA